MQSILNKVEDLGWTVEGSIEEGFEFGKYSVEGQDFNMYIEGKDEMELIDSIYNYHDSYDVSEEAYIWLDDTGHGVNGAPYDMIDVYKDMESIKDMVLELHDELEAFIG